MEVQQLSTHLCALISTSFHWPFGNTEGFTAGENGGEAGLIKVLVLQ